MRFERGKDVKDTLELGVFQKRTFKDDYEAARFIFKVLPIILAKEDDREFPRDWPGLSLEQKLEQYVIKYVAVRDSAAFLPADVADPSLMFLLNHELGRRGKKLKDYVF